MPVGKFRRAPLTRSRAARLVLRSVAGVRRDSVQRAFLDVWKGTPRKPAPLESFVSMEALRRDVRSYYRDLTNFLAAEALAHLDDVMSVPWFGDPHRPVRLSKTMYQVVLHSEHHRAQNATRLRELGGVMPTTDYIVWILDGRSASIWQ